MKNKIRQLRMGKGLTQTQLAKDVGISRPYLADLEKGDSDPSTTIAMEIAKALDSTVESIFSNDLSYKIYKSDEQEVI